MMAAKDDPAEEMSLEWIQMRTEMYKREPETFSQKSVRKFKENPLVPIGTQWLEFRDMIEKNYTH